MSLARKTLPQRRQPMKRVPIAKGDKPLKRSVKPMAKRNAKRRKQDAEVNDLAEFAAIHIGVTPNRYGVRPMCWLCGNNWATEIHHIAGRSSSLRHHRCNLAGVCSSCHEELVPFIGVRAMFWFKRLRDPNGWDRDVAAQLLRAKGQGVL